MIAFSCPKCGKQFTLKDEFAGRTTSCSGCHSPLTVPAETSPAHAGGSPNLPDAGDSPRIAFSCEKCGMKFSVPGECAGRNTTCPTCKQPLTVPTADETRMYVPPPGQLDGMPSILAKSGVEGGVTLGGDFATAEQLSLQNLMDSQAKEGVRYVVESELARGGMGAVMRAVDCDIRREVAVKYLLDQEDAKKKLRFVEEAQITGQLEHPNIVPIHELGIDAEKRIFFSLKMVKGRSLADILKALRDQSHGIRAGSVSDGPASRQPSLTLPPRIDFEKEYSQGKLLNIFINVCNALAYAHARGVVHRDLKPANIMVGDFGEVYVMDWGLAKVLSKGATATGPVMAIPVARLAASEPFDLDRPPAPEATLASPSQITAAAPSSGRIVTSRDSDADLTQDGAVVGTPVYMPPEQAAGKIDEIDERSDIYSMGAILYEILTLQPPVSKDGGYWPILMRVTQGQIEPPMKRAPERARAGKVPPELAAIAMKALSKRKEDRYPSIERLRSDIERFVEGRSVSAKQDTVREMAVKLVRRNKGVSVATTAATVVLVIVAVWSLVAILRANSRALTEELAKREQGKRSVPTFVRVAKVMIQDRQFDDAQTHLDTAVNFDEADPEARFVRATLLVSQQDYAVARTDLEQCLKRQPERAEAKKLLSLLQTAKTDDKATMLALADEMTRQKAFTLTQRIMENAEKLMVSRKDLADNYRQRLKAAYPQGRVDVVVTEGGVVAVALFALPTPDLTPLGGMRITFLTLGDCYQITDLTPLKGMPLERLDCNSCARLNDLSALKGMTLKQLRLYQCGAVNDISALRDMPLELLDLRGCKVDRLSLLKGMPLEVLLVHELPADCDLAPLSGMPLQDLYLTSCASRDLAPLKGLQLKNLVLTGSAVSDLSGLKGMPLEKLSIAQCPVSNLSPLEGLELKELSIEGCKEIRSLAPLRTMPLKQLQIDSPYVTNFQALEGMPIENLWIRNNPTTDLGSIGKMKSLSGFDMVNCPNIADLTPLGGLRLQSVTFTSCNRIADLAPLADQPIRALQITACAVRDLSPLKDMPLTSFYLSDCKEVDDLTPLAGLKLTQVTFPPHITKGVQALREMTTLQGINGSPPAEFWKHWDALKAKSK